MKYLALTAAILCSTGCMYQTVSELEVQKGLALCQANMGPAEITESFLGSTSYRCKNGELVFESDFPDKL